MPILRAGLGDETSQSDQHVGRAHHVRGATEPLPETQRVRERRRVLDLAAQARGLVESVQAEASFQAMGGLDDRLG